jgi:IMP dehydrogenase
MVTSPSPPPPDATIGQVDELCGTYRISGAAGRRRGGHLVGIITNRDMRFEDDPNRPCARS